MHGLGNDFVVINNLSQSFKPTTKHIQSMSNRKTGIGFDQLLLLEPPSDPQADFDYRIFNADGQEVEHCGNGARCIGLYIQQQQLLNTSPIRLKTKQNILPISSDNDIISVNMGQPNLTAEAVHYTQRTTGFAQTLTVDQHTLSFYLVSVGNPHAIVIEPPPYDVDLDQLGTLFNQHTYFPEGINLSIARIEDPENIALQVYERGVGQTQACGTAACAVMAVGRHLKQLASTVRVHQPGGTLIITWQGDGTDLMMRGEACHVFEGQWP